MNRTITLSCALLAFIFSASGQQQKQYKLLVVGFYNVENLFDPEDDPAKQDDEFTPDGSYHYTREVYKEKLHNMAYAIQQMAADVTPDGAAIIGIAEIENDKVLNDLVQQPELSSRGYRYVWFPTPDVRGISTAFLYNPKYFKFLDAKPVRVPLETLNQSRPTRNILYVHGVLAGNDTIHVMVNHWPSRSGGVVETSPYRQLAASVNKQLADSLFAADPNAKIFIMGDLNDNPADASIKKILKAKADTAGIANADIYNPWINVHKKGSGTEIFDGQWNLLDQIMCSGSVINNPNNKWRYFRSRIFKKDFLMHQLGAEQGYPHRSFTVDRHWDNGFSDHFPVLIYLVQ